MQCNPLIWCATSVWIDGYNVMQRLRWFHNFRLLAITTCDVFSLLFLYVCVLYIT